MNDMEVWLDKFNQTLDEDLPFQGKTPEEHIFLKAVHHLFKLIHQVRKTTFIQRI